MADPSSSSSPPPADPITAFWRDVWARAAASSSMPGMPGMPGAAPSDPAGPFLSPDALRRMQAAFFDAMAQYAEQYMRSPQFLDAMKRSMDQAVQFRQQMDDFLKSNMAAAFESASGGASTEILGAIRQVTAQLQSAIASIDRRLADLEAAIGPKRGASRPGSTRPRTRARAGKKPRK